MVETNIANSQPVSDEYLEKMNAYWRAANYLGAAQLYLLDNPLLREPLTMEHVKKKIVGHWGTVPGQNFVYVHLNRVIKKYDQDMICLLYTSVNYVTVFQIISDFMKCLCV